MSVDVQIVRQAAITSGSVQSFKSAVAWGIPKGAMFFMNPVSADATPVAHAIFCAGVTDGTRQFSMCSSSRDGVATSETHHRTSNTKCITLLLQGGGMNAEAQFSKWIAGGIEIDWTNLPGAAYLVTCVLFFGDDLSLYAGDWTEAVTDTDITAPNFAVDQVIWFYNFDTTYDSTDSGGQNVEMAIGFGDKTGPENNMLLFTAGNGQASSVADNQVLNNTSPPGDYAFLNGYDSQGFTAKATPGSGHKIFYLALGFNGKVLHTSDVLDTKTVSGQQYQSSIAFPQFVMRLVSSSNVVDASPAADLRGTFGVGVFILEDHEGVLVARQYTTLITDQYNAADMETNSFTATRSGVCRKNDGTTLIFTTDFTWPGGKFTEEGWEEFYADWNETGGPRKWPTLVIGANRPTVIIPGGIIPGGVIP